MHFHFLPASEIARTPGKTVTFSKSDSPEEAVSPPVSSKKQPASNKTPAKGKSHWSLGPPAPAHLSLA
ncbi:hypothetical protein FKM82_026542 [Ascaphus truei]